MRTPVHTGAEILRDMTAITGGYLDVPNSYRYATAVLKSIEIVWLAQELAKATPEDWNSMDVGEQKGWRDMAVRLKRRLVE